MAQIELNDLPRTRAETTCLPNGARDSSPSKLANCLSRFGQLPAAELAYMKVVEDPATTRDDRRRATNYLVQYGRTPIARKALERWPKEDVPDLIETIAPRERLQSAVTLLMHRISPLARPPSPSR